MHRAWWGMLVPRVCTPWLWLSIVVFSVHRMHESCRDLIYLGACHLVHLLAIDSSHGEKCLCALISPRVLAHWHRPGAADAKN